MFVYWCVFGFSVQGGGDVMVCSDRASCSSFFKHMRNPQRALRISTSDLPVFDVPIARSSVVGERVHTTTSSGKHRKRARSWIEGATVSVVLHTCRHSWRIVNAVVRSAATEFPREYALVKNV